jgi:hypothetical protein
VAEGLIGVSLLPGKAQIQVAPAPYFSEPDNAAREKNGGPSLTMPNSLSLP